jgi:hypothetical protein
MQVGLLGVSVFISCVSENKLLVGSKNEFLLM